MSRIREAKGDLCMGLSHLGGHLPTNDLGMRFFNQGPIQEVVSKHADGSTWLGHLTPLTHRWLDLYIS